MEVARCHQSVAAVEADAVVVGIYDKGILSEPAQQLDAATGEVLHRLLDQEEISGKSGSVAVILAPAGIQARQIVVVGLGEREEFDVGAAFRASAAAAKQLAGKRRRTVAFFPPVDWSPRQLEAAVAGSVTGCHGQGIYQSDPSLHVPEQICWATEQEAAIQQGRILGESLNLTRRLVNEPPNKIYPESFAAQIEDLAKAADLQVEIWDQDRLQSERCGALLAVAQGSSQPPRLVILRHQGGPGTETALALVGKGVTFDSGGLSLKPSEGMQTMKCDMAGAATVVGAMSAIGRLQLPVNVIGLVGLVENMPSASAYKLGDVLTARNGKTIEVLNTDAEGRLVLADVLAVAVDLGAERIIDLATLTGACLVALGADVAGLMTNDASCCDVVAQAASFCGERVWQLPMFPEYGELIKSDVADIKNIGKGRWGGAITAAKFLEHFVGQTKWVHIDIAGPAFFESPKPWMDAGGSGALLRTLVEVTRGLGHSP